MEMLIFWVIMGIVCAIVAHQKRRNVIGWFFLGVLFSLISLVVLIFLPTIEDTKDTIPCPYCKEPIKKDATMCKHCRSVLKE
jgi:hypothetical protein